MNVHRLAAIKVPLADGIHLLLAPDNEPAPDQDLASQPFLPAGWKARLGNRTSPIIYDPSAPQDGMHPLWLVEIASFHWELQTAAGTPWPISGSSGKFLPGRKC